MPVTAEVGVNGLLIEIEFLAEHLQEFLNLCIWSGSVVLGSQIDQSEKLEELVGGDEPVVLEDYFDAI
jgi:hypothetical protein